MKSELCDGCGREIPVGVDTDAVGKNLCPDCFVPYRIMANKIHLIDKDVVIFTTKRYLNCLNAKEAVPFHYK